MFIVTISLKTDLIPKERAEELFAEHRGWFIKYVDRGNFLLLGPFVDDEHAGVVVVDARTAKSLMKFYLKMSIMRLGMLSMWLENLRLLWARFHDTGEIL